MGRVEGKVVIISGAASGIGLASARRLGEEGAKVIMADINAGAGEAAAASQTETLVGRNIDEAIDVLPTLLSDGLNAAMKKLHTKE